MFFKEILNLYLIKSVCILEKKDVYLYILKYKNY